MKTTLLLLLASLSVAAATGCSQAAADDDQDAVSGDDALTGGKPTAAHPEVGRVELDRVGILDDKPSDRQLFCAGTLIAPDIVVTARECIWRSLVQDGGFFYIDKDTNGDGKIDKTFKYTVKHWNNLDHRANARTERSRFEILRLSAPVPASVATPIPMRRTAITPNERVTAVGYGAATASGWGPKNSVSFAYHYGEDTWFKSNEEGPEVLQGAGDMAAPLIDAHGQLAAIGYSQASKSWFLGNQPDYYAETGHAYDELVALVRELEAD